MEQINFSDFIAPEVQNKRKESSLPPKVQEFDHLKYRKAKTEKGGVATIASQFHVAKAMFAALGLSTNALRHFVNPKDKTTVLLGTVADEDGKFLKKREGREKGDAFKSDAFEAALAGAGIIDTSDASVGLNQFIDLIPVGTSIYIPVSADKKIRAYQVFKLVKGTAKKKEEKAEVADDVKAEAPKAEPSQPKAEPQAEVKAAPVASGDEDWN